LRGWEAVLRVSVALARRKGVGGMKASVCGQMLSGGEMTNVPTGISPAALASRAMEMMRWIPAWTHALRAMGQEDESEILRVPAAYETGQMGDLIRSCSADRAAEAGTDRRKGWISSREGWYSDRAV
jgi:hypothetical protein